MFGLNKLSVNTQGISVLSFKPSRLFADNSQGFWLDASDPSVLFQDSAGTTPVTALGDPVGLWLDKSKGLAQGVELVVNGGFTSGITGWTDASSGTGSFVESAGQGLISHGASGTGRARQQLTTVAGSVYKITFYALISSSGGNRFSVGTTAGGSDIVALQSVIPSKQQYVFYFIASGTTTWINWFTGAAAETIRIDDVTVKSVAGNHFIQTGSGARPVWGSWPLSAAIAGYVRNLLSSTEDVTASYWASGSSNITRTSSDTIVETAVSSTHFLGAITNLTSGLTYTQSVTLVKGVLASAPDIMQLTFGGAAFGTSQFANVNVLTGEVVSTAGGATCTSEASTTVAGGWEFTYAATATATASSSVLLVAFCNNNGAATRLPSYAGSTTADCKVYRMQSEQSATATTYQRVGVSSRYDVSEAGQPQVYFVSPDGVDDFMVSAANVDFSATDRMFVCAGVTKKVESPSPQIIVDSPTSTTNGRFAIVSPTGSAANSVATAFRGTSGTIVAVDNTAIAPCTKVVSGISVISSPSHTQRIDGVQIDVNTNSLGTGDFGNALRYIGALGGASGFSSSNIYQLVAVGKTPSTSELNQTETFVAQKTKGSLA